MKKGFLLLTSLAMVVGAGVAVGAHRAPIKNVAAVDGINVYFAGVSGWSDMGTVNIAVNDSWQEASATAGDETSIGQYKASFPSATNQTKLNCYFTNTSNQYRHPTYESFDWNTDYSTINIGEVQLQPGHSYVITWTGWAHNYDNWDHAWFSYTFAEYSEPEPEDKPDSNGYYLVGSKTSWKFAGAEKLTNCDEESGNFAELLNYSVAKDEEFKVKSYFDGVSEWWGIGEGEDNYVADADKIVNIYASKDGKLYVAEPSVDPTTIKYYAKIGDGSYTLMTYKESFIYDETKTGYEFDLTVASAIGGANVAFRKEASEDIHPGTSENHGANNLRTITVNSIQTILSVENKKLKLYVYEDGYDAYLEGYTPTNKTYYFTNNKGWEGTPRYYVFNYMDEPLVAWPGSEMTYTDIDDNNNLRYSFTVDVVKWPKFVLLNNAASDQTVNNSFSTHLVKDGMYLDERDAEQDNKWTLGSYEYSEIVRQIYVGGVAYDLTPSAVQPEGVTLQLESQAIDMHANDQITYRIETVEKDANLEAYGTNNAKIVETQKQVLADATGKVYVKLRENQTPEIYVQGIDQYTKGYHVFKNDSEVIQLVDSGEVPEGFTGQTYCESVSFSKGDKFRLVNTNLDDSLPVPFSAARFDEYSLSSFSKESDYIVYNGTEDIEVSIYLKLLAGNDMVYVGEGAPEVGEAKSFAIAFNSALEAVCKEDASTNYTQLKNAWSAQMSKFKDETSTEAQLVLKNATTSHSVKDIADFIEKYELIFTRYGTRLTSDLGANANFLQKEITPVGLVTTNSQNTNMDSAMLIAIVSIISVVSISSVGILLVIKKRKHN